MCNTTRGSTKGLAGTIRAVLDGISLEVNWELATNRSTAGRATGGGSAPTYRSLWRQVGQVRDAVRKGCLQLLVPPNKSEYLLPRRHISQLEANRNVNCAAWQHTRSAKKPRRPEGNSVLAVSTRLFEVS